MSDRMTPDPYEHKRRKLDDLFADEPYLSPTMKARRLHEKLQELQAADDLSAADVPPAAFVRQTPVWRSAAQSNGHRPRPASGVTLAEVRQRLRAAARYGNLTGGPDNSRLICLRDELLRPWLEEMKRAL